jgi:hypothetical protein
VDIFDFGYYESSEDGDVETIVVIKRHAIVKMKFYNILPMRKRLGG